MAANDLFIGQTITLATGETGRITLHDPERDEWRVTIYHAADSALAGKPMTHRRLRTDEITDLVDPPVDPDKYSHDEDWGAVESAWPHHPECVCTECDRPRDDGTGYPVYRVED
jgi:hypothetical protein